MKRLLGSSERRRAVALLWFALNFCWLVPESLAATFTAETLIKEDDTTYDGQEVVIDGATVTIDGAHKFNSLELKNGAYSRIRHAPKARRSSST